MGHLKVDLHDGEIAKKVEELFEYATLNAIGAPTWKLAPSI